MSDPTKPDDQITRLISIWKSKYSPTFAINERQAMSDLMSLIRHHARQQVRNHKLVCCVCEKPPDDGVNITCENCIEE